MAAMDHLEPQLRSVLGFLGLTDVQTVKIEGVSMGEEATERAMAEARERVRELTGPRCSPNAIEDARRTEDRRKPL